MHNTDRAKFAVHGIRTAKGVESWGRRNFTAVQLSLLVRLQFPLVYANIRPRSTFDSLSLSLSLACLLSSNGTRKPTVTPRDLTLAKYARYCPSGSTVERWKSNRENSSPWSFQNRQQNPIITTNACTCMQEVSFSCGLSRISIRKCINSGRPRTVPEPIRLKFRRNLQF